MREGSSIPRAASALETLAHRWPQSRLRRARSRTRNRPDARLAEFFAINRRRRGPSSIQCRGRVIINPFAVARRIGLCP
ncbi:hypothetical protein BJA5080_01209 [Bradyrhizobium diazoefficiens SEMIA 5080]|uniref:Uncharacterized protein n=1 Tax=Bradyrhizobium diazoefficiens SEMIA 5080 TaxID=754504 RepID=A0A837CFJ6_9BRAD|nr:hypothetical protein BJA5080_01209 [Bradyrhizobium diazoefficiens SEMIA 5080]